MIFDEIMLRSSKGLAKNNFIENWRNNSTYWVGDNTKKIPTVNVTNFTKGSFEAIPLTDLLGLTFEQTQIQVKLPHHISVYSPPVYVILPSVACPYESITLTNSNITEALQKYSTAITEINTDPESLIGQYVISIEDRFYNECDLFFLLYPSIDKRKATMYPKLFDVTCTPHNSQAINTITQQDTRDRLQFSFANFEFNWYKTDNTMQIIWDNRGIHAIGSLPTFLYNLNANTDKKTHCYKVWTTPTEFFNAIPTDCDSFHTALKEHYKLIKNEDYRKMMSRIAFTNS